MSLPRQVLPDKTYLLTHRCIGRRFLMRPDKEPDLCQPEPLGYAGSGECDE